MQLNSDYMKYLNTVKQEKSFDIDKVIFGKNKTERIVCIEVDETDIVLFIEDESGKVRYEFLDNSYWILSPVRRNHNSERLTGNLFYKYITKYSTSQDLYAHKREFPSDFCVFNAKESAMILNGLTYFKGMKVQDVSVLSFDIEATGLGHNNTSKTLLISNTFRKQGKIVKKLFAYDEYESNADFFNAWCSWVREMDPSIITGHNIFGYDLPYLAHCAKMAGTDLFLGRDEELAIKFKNKPSKFRKDGSQQYDYYDVHIFGREIIDTFFLSMKYDIGRNYESYGLKAIIKHENLEKEDRQFYDASTIKDNYQNPEEWLKIKEYAKDDADDALSLYDLMISSYFYYAQSIPKSFQSINNGATGSQLNAFMNRAYLQDGKTVPKTTEAHHYEGAISAGNPGIYKFVGKVDVASLYPSIMIQYEVYDKQKDPEKIFFKTVEYFTNQRLEHKKKAKETGDRYFKDLEQSEKLVINSLYGFMGAPGLNFNSPESAAFVTAKGREILTKGMKWVETNQYTLVNVDTDSFSYTKERPMSQEEFDLDIQDINSLFPERIRWENDGYYSCVIIGAAKNYVLYDGKKIKYKGSALTDQKKETALRQMLEEIFQQIIFKDDTNVVHIYEKYIKESQNITDIKRWSVKKTITKPVLDAGQEGSRLNERKVLDAINEAINAGIKESYSEGDKIYVYNAINGEIQDSAKGELKFYKDGTPKMIPNRILKIRELFSDDEDKDHYLKRVYQTISILDAILNMDDFTNYTLKKHKEDLCNLLNT